MPSAIGSSLQPSHTSKGHAAVESYPICLVTGGSGYIGSYTVLELLNAGLAVVVIDNLANSHMEALCRVYRIAEYERKLLSGDKVPPLFFHQVDLRDKQSVLGVFAYWQDHAAVQRTTVVPVNISEASRKRSYTLKKYKLDTSRRPKPLPSANDPSRHGKIDSVIHFAALKAVGGSVAMPLEYYENNISGLLNLLSAMKVHNVKEMGFSSSAVVYGTGKEANISEDAVQVGGKGTGAGLVINPYGRSKWMAEEILNDCCIADLEPHVTSLRCFNPTGSHPSGLIGEDPKGTPNNIVPVILQAYQRRWSKVYVFGSSYNTQDGTGVRDYIHVSDLAKGHLAALRKLDPAAEDPSITISAEAQQSEPHYAVYNLGTGHGYSVLVLEILGTVTASTKKAQTELEWEAEFGIQDMCRDVYNWAAENPRGYEQLRRLSVAMALQDSEVLRRASIDSTALRKASVSTGLFKTGEDVGESMKSVAQGTRKGSVFGDMMRRMISMALDNTITEEDAEKEPANGHAFTAPVASPKWDAFKPSWQSDWFFSSTARFTADEEEEEEDPLSGR